MHKVLVLHSTPDDVEEARRYYRDVHMPIAAKTPGLISCGFSLAPKTPTGEDSPFFCLYEAVFESEEAMERAFQTDVGKQVVADAANFATAGSVVLHYRLENYPLSPATAAEQSVAAETADKERTASKRGQMRVGLVGIGAIGWPIAATIVRAGHDLTVFDLDTERVRRFASEHGCRVAAGLADVAANEFVVTILPDGRIVREVLLDAQEGAFAAAVKPGTIVIDMSSSDPLGTLELGTRLSKRGVALVDAPISKRDTVYSATSGRPKAGSTPLALVLMVGGERDAVEKARPLLETIGDTVIETGPLGSGHAAKTLNNFAGAGARVALGEAILIGKRFGLPTGKLIEIINLSTGRSFSSEVTFKRLLADENFNSGFSVGLMAKDVKIAADLAEAMGLDAPLARVTRDRWAFARDQLGANADVAQVVPAWDQNLQK